MDRKSPVRHIVASYKREGRHVKTYARGHGKKPTTPFMTHKISHPKPVVDPIREKVEALVDMKIQDGQNIIRNTEGGYWNKIAKFQVNFDGKLWKLIRAYDNGGGKDSEDCQLCGHKHCRYMFVIGHLDKQLTVGSECISNYAVDKDAKDVLRQYQTKVVKKAASVAKHRDLLVNIGMWAHKNGANRFLTSIVGQILDGKDLTYSQRTATERIISKDINKKELEAKNKIPTLFNNAKGKISNDWERKFIISISETLQKGWTLSPKQIDILEKMAKRS